MIAKELLEILACPICKGGLELKGEKLVSYRPFFTDDRTGKTDAAEYIVALFPSEVERKQIDQSKGHIKTYRTA